MKLPTTLTACLLAGALLLTGCSVGTTQEATTAASGAATVTESTGDTDNSVDTHEAATDDPTSGSSVDWDDLATTEVALTDTGLAITEPGTYVLTGSSTGQVTVNADGAVRIILAGVEIASTDGAAIRVDNAAVTVIDLANGSTNSVTDSSSRADTEVDGAIYSADDLVMTGDGALTVNGTFADGIVGKDDLTIEGGIISVAAVDDGIRGKDSVTITDGTITVDADGDGLKASNATDAGEGVLNLTGGTVTVTSGDDAVKAEQQVVLSGGELNITASVEGIEAPVIVINDGVITVNASDDGLNAAASDLITSGLSITINGGDLSVTMGAGDTDAIDSNGDLSITGGTIAISASSAFDFDGSGTLSGGDVSVNGETVTALTSHMMGGGGPGRR